MGLSNTQTNNAAGSAKTTVTEGTASQSTTTTINNSSTADGKVVVKAASKAMLTGPPPTNELQPGYYHPFRSIKGQDGVLIPADSADQSSQIQVAGEKNAKP